MLNFRRWLLQVVALVALAFASLGAAAETVTYFHNDVSGTPLVATDAAGNVVWKENYRPYGDRLTNAPASAGNTLWFAGKSHDAATGLSYMGARYYHPTLGRFMSFDPKGIDPEDVQALNGYVYANNNPYKFVDPDGHSPIDVVFLAYDIGKLGMAIYKGDGIGGAAADVAMSAVGFISPVPGAGQALKMARVVDHGADAVRAGERAAVTAEKAAGAAKGLHRPYVRKGTRQEVEASAPRDATGRPIDPNTGRPIEGKPDFGHKPGHEHWREKQKAEAEGLSQKEFNNRMNDPKKYQLEDSSSNRSRRHEQKN